MLSPFSCKSQSSRLRGRRPRLTRLELEPLEDRWVPSAGYNQVNLTGYLPGMARHTDPNLNGWGMDFAPHGPFCVANTATGVVTFYDHDGDPLPTVITIPPAPSQPFGPLGSPTGLVYNPTTDFVISENGRSAPARFIFDTLDGLICGWNPDVDATNAIIMVDNSQESPFVASYTGLVIAQNSQCQNVLYAADSGNGPTISNNRIDMFDGSFSSLGSFADPNVATQYPGNTVFQVEAVKGNLYVTFAGFKAPFGGVVDVFDTDGNLLTPSHFAANAPGAGPLVNPWGIVQAPSNFGTFSNDLLIGNVEDGHINAFDPNSGAFLGSMNHPDGTSIVITGLWDLAFGAGSPKNGKKNELFFTAGVTSSDFSGNGLFGMITATKGDDGPSHDGHHEGQDLSFDIVGQQSGSLENGQSTATHASGDVNVGDAAPDGVFTGLSTSPGAHTRGSPLPRGGAGWGSANVQIAGTHVMRGSQDAVASVFIMLADGEADSLWKF